MFEHVPCSQDPSRAISEAREMRFPVPVSFCSTWGGGGWGGWMDRQCWSSGNGTFWVWQPSVDYPEKKFLFEVCGQKLLMFLFHFAILLQLPALLRLHGRGVYELRYCVEAVLFWFVPCCISSCIIALQFCFCILLTSFPPFTQPHSQHASRCSSYRPFRLPTICFLTPSSLPSRTVDLKN